MQALDKEIKFGTGGLREIMGPGPGKMNVELVGKASRGLANYLWKKHAESGQPAVVIGYDSRLNSTEFARTAAETFAEMGVDVWLWSELTPVSMVSYAVRQLGTDAGVMITASHNPKEYNGYKVYGADGCQITDCAAEQIYEQIIQADNISEKSGVSGRIKRIPEWVQDGFIEAVKATSLRKLTEEKEGLYIVYSPLNGAGLRPVIRALDEMGYSQITVVPQQAMPDGNFPTCPRPNPEEPATMKLALELAVNNGADLVLATDPDCDRVGVAARRRDGEFALLSGNEVGILLLDYVCQARIDNGTMPENAIAIKTIVTSDMAFKVTNKYGVKMLDCLTGFKYIGEQIGVLEKQGKTADFILGIEESCGYLAGDYVRDKDGVGACLLIAEMAAYYKSQGLTLWQRMEELYREFGRYECSQECVNYEVPNGVELMKGFMDELRNGAADSEDLYEIIDYSKGVDGLPKSNVLKFIYKDGSTVTYRPSGTEPKLKKYFCKCVK